MEVLVLEPLDHGADVVGLDRAAVLEPQQVLDQHLEREGQLGDAGQPVLLGIGQREVLVGLGADLQGLAALEAVGMGGAELMSGNLLDEPSPRSSSGARIGLASGRIQAVYNGSNMRSRAGKSPMKLIGDKLSSIRGGRTLFAELSFARRRRRGAAADGAERRRQDHAACASLRVCCGPLRAASAWRAATLSELGRAVPLCRASQCREGEPDGGGERGLLVPLSRRRQRERIERRSRPSAWRPCATFRPATCRPGRSGGWVLRALLLAERPVWLLDEPTASLDGAAQEALTARRERAPGRAAAWWWRPRMCRSASPGRASCISARLAHAA